MEVEILAVTVELKIYRGWIENVIEVLRTAHSLLIIPILFIILGLKTVRVFCHTS